MPTIASHPRMVNCAAAALGLVVVFAAAIEFAYGPVLIGILLGLAALRAPTAAWVGATVALVLLVRVPTTFGPVPEAAVQLPILTAWGALMLALVRTRRLNPQARDGLLLLAIFIATIFISGFSAGTELTRGLLYLSLIGTPFALLATMLLEPPDSIWRRRLIVLLLGLLAIQIPFVIAQTIYYGNGDPVKGTLVGSLIGHHQIAAVAVIGAIWILLSGPHNWISRTAVAVLLLVPFLTAANQVIFALPIAVLAAAFVGRSPLRGPAVAAMAGTLLLLLAMPGWNSDYARQTLGRFGESVKAEPAGELAADISERNANLVFGQGPGTTVSGAALLTIEENSLIERLSLDPATFPRQLASLSADGSIQRPISSSLGVFGDLGLVGAFAFLGLFVYVFDRTRRQVTPMGQAATAGLAMMAVLGFFNDAFEQPPYALFLMVLVGLAMTTPQMRSPDEPGAATR